MSVVLSHKYYLSIQVELHRPTSIFKHKLNVMISDTFPFFESINNVNQQHLTSLILN